MHQAASTIQRRFKRHITRTEYFRKIAESSIEQQENDHFATYLSRVLEFQYFIIESSAPQITTMEQGLERKFGGFPLSAIDARARKLTIINRQLHRQRH